MIILKQPIILYLFEQVSLQLFHQLEINVLFIMNIYLEHIAFIVMGL